MKKKVYAIVVLILCVTALFLMWHYVISYSLEKRAVVIKRGFFSGFSYEIYGDHVELTKYQGNEKEVKIPEYLWFRPVTVLGEECFAYNEIIEKIILTENITSLEYNAVSGLENLLEVTGGVNVRKIGKYSFAGNWSMNKLELGNQIEVIEENAFEHCYKLTDLGKQLEIEYIGEYAFYDSGVQTLEINRDVEIGSNAFAETAWPENHKEPFVIYGDGILLRYNGTDTVVHVPDGIKIINDAFENRPEVQTVYLPDSVTAIYEFSFAYNGEIEVYIPASVTRLGYEDGESGMMEDVDLTICTTEGSYAQQYAESHDIDYKIVEPW